MNDTVRVENKDETLMQLAHYFITVENYTPIVVKGVKNEIWLENIDAPYKVIRINANYLHNKEQFDFDIFKIKGVIKQVRKKTLSFSVKTLNILLDVGNSVEVKDAKNIDCVHIDITKELTKNKKLNSLYPELKNNLVNAQSGIEFLINVTNDINVKTEKENIEYERVFRKKGNFCTISLIAINILLYILTLVGEATGKFDLLQLLALNKSYVVNGDIYRLFTSAFMHASVFHLAMNMYALYIIGGQVESYIGSAKFSIVYIFSAITGALLSCIANGAYNWSLGASGAIFGLMGSLLFFGYHYRLYLDNALKTQIIPLIVLNLAIGFLFQGIDNAAHIGGLVGGLFMTMAVGIKNKSSKTDTINGIICSTILTGTLVFLLFFAK